MLVISSEKPIHTSFAYLLSDLFSAYMFLRPLGPLASCLETASGVRGGQNRGGREKGSEGEERENQRTSSLPPLLPGAPPQWIQFPHELAPPPWAHCRLVVQAPTSVLGASGPRLVAAARCC